MKINYYNYCGERLGSKRTSTTFNENELLILEKYLFHINITPYDINAEVSKLLTDISREGAMLPRSALLNKAIKALLP